MNKTKTKNVSKQRIGEEDKSSPRWQLMQIKASAITALHVYLSVNRDKEQFKGILWKAGNISPQDMPLSSLKVKTTEAIARSISQLLEGLDEVWLTRFFQDLSLIKAVFDKDQSYPEVWYLPEATTFQGSRIVSWGRITNLWAQSGNSAEMFPWEIYFTSINLISNYAKRDFTDDINEVGKDSASTLDVYDVDEFCRIERDIRMGLFPTISTIVFRALPIQNRLNVILRSDYEIISFEEALKEVRARMERE